MVFENARVRSDHNQTRQTNQQSMSLRSKTRETNHPTDNTFQEFTTAILRAVVLQLTLPERLSFPEFIAFSDQAHDQLLTEYQRTQEDFQARTTKLEENFVASTDVVDAVFDRKLKEAATTYLNKITEAKKLYYPKWMDGTEEIERIRRERRKGTLNEDEAIQAENKIRHKFNPDRKSIVEVLRKLERSVLQDPNRCLMR